MKDPEVKLKLTTSINSLVVVGKLITELELIEEFFLKMKLKSSLSQVSLPTISPVMQELTNLNNLNLIRPEDRANLNLFLHFIKTKAPTIHVSFASIPDSVFMQKITDWFRSEINPNIMLSIGLQPNIGAGFKIRTTNKIFDFSLHKYLIESRQILVQLLGQVKT
jgi:hypothetical protein